MHACMLDLRDHEDPSPHNQWTEIGKQVVIRQAERCSGSAEEEMPAIAQSKYGDRLHRAMTSWLGVKAAGR